MKREIATLAGGCFWGMEDLIRKLPGILDTEVGYTGGKIPDATYDQVKTVALVMRNPCKSPSIRKTFF